VPTLGWIPPQPDNAHIEGFGELGKASADLPQTHHKERLGAQLVLALGEVANHAAPNPSFLIVARLGKPAAPRQDEGHGMFRDRAVVDAARAGEADAALCQLIARELIGAGADRLYETKFRRAVEKMVLPQPGDHQHIRLA